jgi:hypothetical protein
MGRCIDCKHSIGAEYQCGKLYVWCTYGIDPKERQFLADYCEPREAHRSRKCDNYTKVRRRKVREETLEECLVAELQDDGLYVYAIGNGEAELMWLYTEKSLKTSNASYML